MLSSFAQAPFAPDDIAGLVLWLDADTLALSDGDPVGTWTDGSGTANDATQTGANRPTYKTGIVNSLPVVRFDGTTNDQFMTFPTDPGTVTSSFVVGALHLAAASQIGYASFLQCPDIWISGVLADGCSTNWGTFADVATCVSAGEVLGTDVFNILELTNTVAGNQIRAYRNGVQKISISDACSGSALNQIGGDNSASRWLNCDIAEVIIYNTVLSAGNRAQVEGYLSAKYGL